MGLLGLVWVGSGWLNGDAAAYTAQGLAADPTDRWTHVGYAAMAVALAPVAGPRLPVALDVVGVLATVVAAMAAGRLGGPVAAVGAAAALLPWGPFAEVDPVWIAAVVLSGAGARGAMALGVAVSPVALLAIPWAMQQRRTIGPAVEGAVAVLLLVAVSQGDWIIGERGVWSGSVIRPGRTLIAWATAAPWVPLIALLARPSRIVALIGLAPLILAPPDVPGWALGGIAVAVAVGEGAVALGPLAVAIQLGIGAGAAADRADRVATEAAVVQRIASSLAATDGLVAPWTWGSRIAVARSGDPYGIPWHPPGRWLRDQRRTWCAAAPTRLVILPPPVRTAPNFDDGCP